MRTETASQGGAWVLKNSLKVFGARLAQIAAVFSDRLGESPMRFMAMCRNCDTPAIHVDSQHNTVLEPVSDGLNATEGCECDRRACEPGGARQSSVGPGARTERSGMEELAEAQSIMSHSTAFHLNSAPPLRAGRGPVAETVTGPGPFGLVAR